MAKKKKKPSKPAKEHNPWHAGFRDAIEAVFEPYRDVLELKFEHQLSAEALRLDVLVIKKQRDAPIQHDIAGFFKTWNIIEYKSPDDTFAIPDFHKVRTYAHGYMAKEHSNGAVWSEGTITVIRTGEPQSVLTYIAKRGLKVTQRRNADGEVWAYELVDYEIPFRIIQSEHLAASDHLLLRYLRKDLDTTTLRKVLEEGDARWKLSKRKAYLQVLLEANGKQIEEVKAMITSPILLQAIEESGLAEKWRKQGEERGRHVWERDRQAWLAQLQQEMAARQQEAAARQQTEAAWQQAEAENAALKEQLRLFQQAAPYMAAPYVAPDKPERP
jgi:hypothetical protein